MDIDHFSEDVPDCAPRPVSLSLEFVQDRLRALLQLATGGGVREPREKLIDVDVSPARVAVVGVPRRLPLPHPGDTLLLEATRASPAVIKDGGARDIQLPAEAWPSSEDGLTRVA